MILRCLTAPAANNKCLPLVLLFCCIVLLVVGRRHAVKAAALSDYYQADVETAAVEHRMTSTTTLVPLSQALAGRKIPVLFKSSDFYFVNMFGNCPGNFMSYVSVDGVAVDSLDACLRRCTNLPLCRSVAVRIRDLPHIRDNGEQSADNVTHCWLKTVAECRDFVAMGRNIEATMLVRYANRPMVAKIKAERANPWQNLTANCTVDGLPPPSPLSITMEIGEGSQTPVQLKQVSVIRVNSTAYMASAVIPGLPRGSVNRLYCTASNANSETIQHHIEIRPLNLPKFSSFKLFFDEITNGSARIRWSRWNASFDIGDAPVIGYKLFVKQVFVDDDDGEEVEGGTTVKTLTPSSIVTAELMNATFRGFVADKSCSSRSSCQFHLPDLEPNSRYLVGVMAVRPDEGGDNGSISWSVTPLITRCGKPDPIERLTPSIRWRKNSPQLVLSFEPPRRVNCPEVGQFLVSYVETDVEQASKVSFAVPGKKRIVEISQLKAGSNYTLSVLYKNVENEDSDPRHIEVSTVVPMMVAVVSTGAHTVTLGWALNVGGANAEEEMPSAYRIIYWLGSARMPSNDKLVKSLTVQANESCHADTAQCSATVEGLRANSPHYFSIMALTSTYDEMYRSDALSVSTACEVPSPPYNLTLAKQTRQVLSFQWELDFEFYCPITLVQLDLSNRQLHMVVNASTAPVKSYDFAMSDISTWLLNTKSAVVKARVMNIRGLFSEWSDATDVVILSAASSSAERVVPAIARSSSASSVAIATPTSASSLPTSVSTLTPQPEVITTPISTPSSPAAVSSTTTASVTTKTAALTTSEIWSTPLMAKRRSVAPSTPGTSLSPVSTTTAYDDSFFDDLQMAMNNATVNGNNNKVPSHQTMIIGIVVGCGCVASMLAVLCILLLKKKKIFTRNKVSRFSNSGTSSGVATSPSLGGHEPVEADHSRDYYMKGEVRSSFGNGVTQTQTSNMADVLAGGIFQSPPDSIPSSTSPAADMGRPNQQQLPAIIFNNNKISNGSPPLSTTDTMQTHLNCSSANAWSSPGLLSTGSALPSKDHATNTASTNSINNHNKLPIRLDRLKQAIAERRTDDSAGFRKEFASLSRKVEKSQDIGKAKVNSLKNRYRDIFPYDYNCVLLDDESNAKEPIYVNASYIKGASGEREYVASQGPSAVTVGDFWKMIWQLNITRVVMLTNTHEKGKSKSHKYWPDIYESAVFDGISVETVNEQHFSYFVRRTMRVRVKQLSERTETCSRIVTQFQFTNWPDHHAVRFATPVVSFLRKINKHIRLSNHASESNSGTGNNNNESPLTGTISGSKVYPINSLMLVHCSAGIGRTGTLLAADIAIKRAEAALVSRRSPHDIEIDVRGIVTTLREQRHKMVQNLEQYMFLYDVVYEALSYPAGRPTSMSLSMATAAPADRLQREFDTLERTKPIIPRQEFDIAMDIKNAGKNRVQRVLPASFCRVPLLTVSDDKQDYLSAIWLDGIQMPRSLMAAQTPMPHTVVDFWSAVWDYNVAAIVSLDPQPCLDPTYCQVGPSEGVELVHHGNFKVKSLRRTAVNSRRNGETSRPYVVNVLSLSHSQKRSETSREVRHFEYTGAWVPNVRGTPQSVEHFAEFVTGIDETRKAARGRPIIVHCLDGATRSGLTLLTILLKEQCECDDEVDVFTSLKMIRNSRPEFIPNLEQYSFAYTFVSHVLGSESPS